MKNLWNKLFPKAPVSPFLQDFNFQYDLKMLSQNRFDKLTTSSYAKLLSIHSEYLTDQEYLKSPFYSYVTKIHDILSQATVNYGKFISEIREVNHSNENLVSDLNDAFYQNHPNR